MRNQGYLPEQIIAFSMAWLSKYRGEQTHYKKYLNESIGKFFLQSEEYLEQGN